jgi:hypothetical protein
VDEFHIDGESFDAAVRNLFEAAERVDGEVTAAMLEIGETFKATAKQFAGEHSQSIPPTIRVEPAKHAVVVKAGNSNVALAALYDLGNEGKGGRKKDTFRHPVFGNRDVWVEQKRYPFFAPTRKVLRQWINERIDKIWDEALRPFMRSGE